MLVFHENVPGFGEEEFRKHLADIYFICRLECDFANEGWAVHRPRQVIMMILLCWGLDVLAESGIEVLPSTVEMLLHKELNIERSISEIFDRNCNFHWTEFMICSVQEIAEDRRWASSRPKLKQMEAHCNQRVVPYGFSRLVHLVS